MSRRPAATPEVGMDSPWTRPSTPPKRTAACGGRCGTWSPSRPCPPSGSASARTGSPAAWPTCCCNTLSLDLDLRPAGGPDRGGGGRSRPQQARPRRRPRRGGQGGTRPAAGGRADRAARHDPRPLRGRDAARRRHPVRRRRRPRGSGRRLPQRRLPDRAGPTAAGRRGQPDRHRRPAAAGRGAGAASSGSGCG